jgi:general secretion pathway protein G
MFQEGGSVGVVFYVRHRRACKRLRHRNSGYTLLDLMAVVGVVALLLGIAVPSYSRYSARAKTSAAVGDISTIHLAIETYIMNGGAPPPNLAAIGKDGMLDPWGRPYNYLSFDGLKGKGKMRKDKNLVPINSEYDLYSAGPDGETVPPLTAKPSRDDIVMANNGKFIGLASDY